MKQKLPGKGNYKDLDAGRQRDERVKGWSCLDFVPPWKMKPPLDPDPWWDHMKKARAMIAAIEAKEKK